MFLQTRNNWSERCSSSRRASCGFTVLELLVAISIIGVMIAMLLPAVLYARESARRITCVNQMRQLGIGLQQYHSTRQRLPASWSYTESDKHFVYGWGTAVLDDIEQSAIRQRFDARQRPTSEVFAALQEFDLALLKCPSDITEPTFELVVSSETATTTTPSHAPFLQMSGSSRLGEVMTLPTANYVGVFGTSEADDFAEFGTTLPRASADGAVVHDRKVRWKDLQRGLSNTMLVGERTMATVPSTWFGVDLRGEDAPCRVVGSAITRPNCETCDECEFSSRHTGGANFLWADGHVDEIADSIETQVYRTFAVRVSSE